MGVLLSHTHTPLGFGEGTMDTWPRELPHLLLRPSQKGTKEQRAHLYNMEMVALKGSASLVGNLYGVTKQWKSLGEMP